MAIEDDVTDEIREAVHTNWSARQGRVIPDDDSVTFGNDAVSITGVVLYADLAASTDLVEKYTKEFSATAIKSFLLASARLVRYFDGEITAYDGDRIMAIYIDERARTRAARTALAINWAMIQVVNPELKTKYRLGADFYLGHAIGIDVSDLLVIKAGIRAGSDLTWIGRAANKAAKLSAIREGTYRTFIDRDVYHSLATDAKLYNGEDMWEERTYQGRFIHRSSWWLKPSV